MTMPVHQLLRMGQGAVVELDQSEDEDALILANKPSGGGRKRLRERPPITIEVRELCAGRGRSSRSKSLVEGSPIC
jgi:Type III flagellar switch regulator (C-ring) FliN C-term